MHVDMNGSIYILDLALGRVTKWEVEATSGVVVAGDYNVRQLMFPTGMYVESMTSIIWIADTGNDRIVKWLSPTNSVVVGGSYGTGPNQFHSPSGVFIDENDGKTMYVADSYNNRIQRWLFGTGNGTTVAGSANGESGSTLSMLAYPVAVVVDANQYMFIVDESNYRILRWRVGATSGELIADNYGAGAVSDQLVNPSNMAFGSDGSIFVADSNKNRIQKFTALCGKSFVYIYIHPY